MDLYYKILKRGKPGLKQSEGLVYYPHPQRPGTYDMDDIAKAISTKSTMSEADVYGVLRALVDEVAEKASEGSIVSLDKLGTFKLTFKSQYQESSDTVTASCITGTRLIFHPSIYIKKKLKNITYKKGK